MCYRHWAHAARLVQGFSMEGATGALRDAKDEQGLQGGILGIPNRDPMRIA